MKQIVIFFTSNAKYSQNTTFLTIIVLQWTIPNNKIQNQYNKFCDHKYQIKPFEHCSLPVSLPVNTYLPSSYFLWKLN